MGSFFLIVLIPINLSPKNMATNEELEKRIETLEKEVQHLKAILQYQMRNKKKWFILNLIEINYSLISNSSALVWISNFKTKF